MMVQADELRSRFPDHADAKEYLETVNHFALRLVGTLRRVGTLCGLSLMGVPYCFQVAATLEAVETKLGDVVAKKEIEYVHCFSSAARHAQ